MSKTADYLFARVAGFHCEVEALRRHYREHVMKFPGTNYRDNEVNYVGWAVTSRDGSLEDGVRRISTKPGAGGKQDNRRGMALTAICCGALEDTMVALNAHDFRPYRVRIMSLTNEGAAMPFHVDAKKETWRLHIPITTNENCFFEWERGDGSIESVHLPADGSAWLVRVDVRHRAVNFSNQASERVHLLMGLNELPPARVIGEPNIPLDAAVKTAQASLG